MKLIKSFFVAAIALVAFNASAQTADEVVGKYLTAMGGADKLKSLKTVKMEGNLSTQGLDIPITLTRKNDVGMRVDLEIMGTSNYQIFNTEKGWMFMPVQGQTEPQEMPAEAMKSVRNQFDLAGPLVDSKAKGYTVEYLGMDKVDGADAYKLKVEKDGNVQTFFIDAKTNFLVKVVTKASVNGEDMEVENTYADYKQTPDGYWFAHSSTSMQGTMVYDKITVNAEVDDKIFSN